MLGISLVSISPANTADPESTNPCLRHLRLILLAINGIVQLVISKRGVEAQLSDGYAEKAYRPLLFFLMAASMCEISVVCYLCIYKE